jgi:hypothetical protein
VAGTPATPGYRIITPGIITYDIEEELNDTAVSDDLNDAPVDPRIYETY